MSREPADEAPDDLSALQRAALAAYQERRFDLAADHFARAVELAPDAAPLWSNLGNAHLSNGDEEAAVAAYRRALALAPDLAETHYNLAAALRRRGEPGAAARAYADAISLGLSSHEVHNNMGIALKEDGRLTEAISAYRRALSLCPESAAIHVNLANALGDLGRQGDAITHYETALALDPDRAEAHFNLFAALHDTSPAAAEASLRRAIAARPDYHAAHFQLAALLALAGDPAAAAHLDRLPEALGHLRTSLEFVLGHRTSETRVFTDGFHLLSHAFSRSPSEGLIIELGVRHGTSIDFIASLTGSPIHGFDSFEGLPEAWGGLPKGAYSTQGHLPAVAPNVTLHAGWFSDTLAPFASDHPGPVRFMNIDCDLYSSTREALDVFAPRLVSGSVVVFDEYLANPGWQDEEHRALVEAARAHGFAYDYIAVSLFSRQAAIRVR